MYRQWQPESDRRETEDDDRQEAIARTLAESSTAGPVLALLGALGIKTASKRMDEALEAHCRFWIEDTLLHLQRPFDFLEGRVGNLDALRAEKVASAAKRTWPTISSPAVRDAFARALAVALTPQREGGPAVAELGLLAFHEMTDWELWALLRMNGGRKVMGRGKPAPVPSRPMRRAGCRSRCSIPRAQRTALRDRIQLR